MNGITNILAELGGRVLESEAWSVSQIMSLWIKWWTSRHGTGRKEKKGGGGGEGGVAHSTGPQEEVWRQHHTKLLSLQEFRGIITIS